jgi:hypothetical protein
VPRVDDLANRFSTSAVTIRNDLNDLHERGLVLRSHGGAWFPDTILRDSPVEKRLNAHSEEKRRIGAMAAMLIHDGETIILASGTTTLEIARELKNKQGLQIITNGVNIAAELLDARGVQIFIVGGTVRGDSASIIGRSTEDMFEQFSADSYFSVAPDAIRTSVSAAPIWKKQWSTGLCCESRGRLFWLPAQPSSPSAARRALRRFLRLIPSSAIQVFVQRCRRSCVRSAAT